jgi:hypothetical protein
MYGWCFYARRDVVDPASLVCGRGHAATSSRVDLDVCSINIFVFTEYSVHLVYPAVCGMRDGIEHIILVFAGLEPLWRLVCRMQLTVVQCSVYVLPRGDVCVL